jgi:micrococcal nuclease
MRIPFVQPNALSPADTIIRGRCWVVDGDTIVIDQIHIRLAGIDAPELDHPWGQQSKWALVRLCKGQTITARIKPEMSYERVVAECFLPDGRDLAAELVKAGLALDWPKFSGGKYRQLEPADARKKLWRANLRQGGMMGAVDDMLPAPRHAKAALFRPRRYHRLGWLTASGFLLLLAGCQLVGGNTGQNAASARPSPLGVHQLEQGE